MIQRLSDLREDLTQVDDVQFIGGVYPRQHITMIASAPGTGKTWLILKHAIDMTTGDGLTCGDIFPESLDHPYKVVIFCGEAGGAILSDRLRKMGMEEPSHSLSVYTLTNLTRHSVPITLDTPGGMTTFRNIVHGEKPDIVFVDTLIAFRSEDDNDQKSASLMLGNLRQVAEDNDCAMVITHHLRKRKVKDRLAAVTQDDIIGTSAFTRLCSIAYVLTQQDFSESISIACVKSWWRKPRARAFRLNGSGSHVSLDEVVVEDDSSFVEKARVALERMSQYRTVTISSLAEDVGCSIATASRVMKEAVENHIMTLYWHDGPVKYFKRL